MIKEGKERGPIVKAIREEFKGTGLTTAEINVAYKKCLENAEKEEEYSDLFANPYQAAQYGYIDDVIEPRNTRFRICRGLAQLASKKQSLPAKKHGCMPM